MAAAPTIPTMRSEALLPLEGAAATRRVAWLSVGAAVLLTALKLGGWLASGSVGLLASLADSALDVLAATGTLMAVRFAVTPPDAEHRYGHGKAEAFASLLQGALVLASAVLIGREAVVRLFHPVAVWTQGWALLIMAVATLVAMALVIAQSRVLARARSVAIEGDRTHYLADVASNIAAFAGIAVATGFHAPRADAAAGLVVSAWLVWGAFGMARNAADNLMDRELDDAERDEIRVLIQADPLVFAVHDLRTRASGPIVHIQAHVALAPDTTVEAAHRVLVQAERRIVQRFPAADIMLQPDPHGCAEPHAGAFANAVREGGAFEVEVTRDLAPATKSA